jgi:hypothetical protein
MRYLAWLLIFLCEFSVAWAKPVSFKDGWGIMVAAQEDWADYQLNYSVTNRYSVGASEYYRRSEESTTNFGMAQFNYLLQRWNELDSQGNIYGSLGFGGSYDSVHDQSVAGYAAIEADYETRRIYTLIAAETLQAAHGVAFNRLRARVGIAPYLAPFEALQTWIIMQVEQMPEMEDETTLTPLLRFFYNNLALEAGISTEGKVFVAAMVHF